MQLTGALGSITRNRLIPECFIFHSKVINLIIVLRRCLFFCIELHEFDLFGDIVGKKGGKEMELVS